MTKKKKKAGSPASAKPRHLLEGWLDEDADLLGVPRDAMWNGYNGVFYPERGVCLQEGKAWVAFGDTALDESFSGVELVENYDDLELEEREIGGKKVKVPKNGVWIVEGPAQRSDVKNANKRVYSRKIWETLIADDKSYVQDAIKERRMVGHLEHPKDGRTDLNESALVVVEAKLQKDGVVWGKFELLETPKGLILQELTRKGVKWGVSSRGTGTVGDDGNVSEDDYHLKTWDGVASPSTPGAHPTLSASEGEDDATNETTLDDPPQAELSEAHEETFQRLIELSETEADDLVSRVALRDEILEAFLSLDEGALQSILLRDEGWAQVANAISKAREGSDGDAIDTAIDEALANGEEAEDVAAFTEIIEALQEQVSTSVDEVRDLQERLEVAESERESQTERLTETEGELAQLRVECDLAYELLAEAPSRDAGDVAAAVDEAIEKESALVRLRPLLERAESVEQVRIFVESLIPFIKKPKVKAPVEETNEPKRPARTALPAGIGLDSTDYVRPKTKPQIAESSGARLVGAMTGFRKQNS